MAFLRTTINIWKRQTLLRFVAKTWCFFLSSSKHSYTLLSNTNTHNGLKTCEPIMYTIISNLYCHALLSNTHNHLRTMWTGYTHLYTYTLLLNIHKGLRTCELTKMAPNKSLSLQLNLTAIHGTVQNIDVNHKALTELQLWNWSCSLNHQKYSVCMCY